MPRKRELTWQAGTGSRQGRWKKKYRGQTLYLGSAGSKSDLEAYRAALAVWHDRKAAIDAEIAARPKPHQADYEAAIGEWDQVLRWSLEHSDEARATEARLKLADLRERLEQPDPPALIEADRFFSQFTFPRHLATRVLASLPDTFPASDRNILSAADRAEREKAAELIDGSPWRIQREIWQDRLQAQSPPEPVQDQSLGAHVKRYLAGEQHRVDAGQLSAGRFTSKRNNLHDFRDWLGHSTALKAITSGRLLEYRDHLLTGIAADQLARDTAHGRLNDIQSFVRWLWETESLVELPRILQERSRKLAIGKSSAPPEFFSMAEVQRCLKEANERLRLYLLLMLNCGMYQGDISSLRHDEVDWKAGTISRKRTKTRAHKSVPTVRYRLWPQTLQLLMKHRTTAGARVLLNRNGNPLVVRDLKPNGEARTNDNVKNAYDRLKQKTGIRKPLKLLRKTSANLIRSSDQYRGLEDLFLGHSPSRMSDRHYTAPPEELLAEATDWLGQQYGVS